MRRIWVAFILAVALTGCQNTVTLRGPGQPPSGPGGADYAHREVSSQRFGEGADEYWIFSPTEPAAVNAPIVVFLHGWGGTSPYAYGAWIRHIVRKGHAVIYPRYQESTLTPAPEMLAAAQRAVQAGLAEIERTSPGNLGEHSLAWVGHSLGGTIATMLSANWGLYELPITSLLMVVEPGGDARLALGDLSGMPADALVLVVTGDRDRVAGDRTGRHIFAGLAHLPRENIDFVTLRSEDRLNPPLEANHMAPLARIAGFPPDSEPTNSRLQIRRDAGAVDRYAPDALDYYGTWKLLDGLLDAAFRGVHREFALGGRQAQRFMGVLSNGEPLTPLLVESEE